MSENNMENGQYGTMELTSSKKTNSGDMNYSRAGKKVLNARLLFIWMTQMLASLSWFTACIIYDSYGHGDIWQIVSPRCIVVELFLFRVIYFWRWCYVFLSNIQVASLSWTCGNIASFVDVWVDGPIDDLSKAEKKVSTPASWVEGFCRLWRLLTTKEVKMGCRVGWK